MFAVKDYEGNVLTLIDESIDDNKLLRQLYSLGRVVQADALPYENSPVEYGFTGSNRTHIAGKPNNKWSCSLVEVSNISEVKGVTPDSVVLIAFADCWCGRLINHPVSMEIDMTDLNSRVHNIDVESFNL